MGHSSRGGPFLSFLGLFLRAKNYQKWPKNGQKWAKIAKKVRKLTHL